MKNTTLSLIALLVAQTLIAPLAQANESAADIRGPKYSLKREAIGGEKFRYRFCEHLGKASQCETIGKEDGYTDAEIQLIMKSEKTEAILKATIAGFSAVVLTITAAVGGWALAPYLAAAIPTVDGFSAYLITWSVAGASVPLWFRKLNPIVQFNQASVLKKSGLNNKEIVTVSDGDVKSAVKLLREILE